jgi:hypothetical protein
MRDGGVITVIPHKFKSRYRLYYRPQLVKNYLYSFVTNDITSIPKSTSVQPFSSYKISSYACDVKSDSANLGWMRRVACAVALSPLHLTNSSPSLVDVTECRQLRL